MMQHEESALTFRRRFVACMCTSQYSPLKTTVHKYKYFQKGLSFVEYGYWALGTYYVVNRVYTNQFTFLGYCMNADEIILRSNLISFCLLFLKLDLGPHCKVERTHFVHHSCNHLQHCLLMVVNALPFYLRQHFANGLMDQIFGLLAVHVLSP